MREYYLWDIDSANMCGWYESRKEAIDILTHLYYAFPNDVDDFILEECVGEYDDWGYWTIDKYGNLHYTLFNPNH